MPAPPTGPTGFLVSGAMELPFRDGRLLVAAKPVEAAAAVHQPSRGTADDWPDLLDAPDGPVRRESAAVRLGQQCRPAALLCVRADRLCGRGADRRIADTRYVHASLWGDRGAAAPQPMAWPLQGVGRVAVDCLLPARAAIDVCRALLWPEPRCRRAFDDQHLRAPGHRRDRPPTRSRILGHSVI